MRTKVLTVAFLRVNASVVLWAGSGPFFGSSENWQLAINTGTTIVMFVMVFLIQNTRYGVALQAKLDELIRSSAAEDEFMGIEKLTDSELEALHGKCEAAARRTDTALKRTRAEREVRQRRGSSGQR